MQTYAIQSTDAERRERPLMLEPSELALDGSAAAVLVHAASRAGRGPHPIRPGEREDRDGN